MSKLFFVNIPYNCSDRELQEWAQEVFAEAERAQASCIRWLEEGIWPTSAGFPLPQFFEAHALLNYQVKMYPSAALCQ